MVIFIFGCISAVFLFLSVRTYRSHKPVNLWANDSTEINVSDIKSYNSACAKLLAFYSMLLFLSGILVSMNHIALTIAGYLATVFSSLGLIIIYTFIETKYKN